MKYNGYKNWNHWNVSLWLFNDEGLYRLMCDCVWHADTLDGAAHLILSHFNIVPKTLETPDGAPYTFTSIRAALKHWGK